MIDFGVTKPCKSGVLQHTIPWVLGNHEDGYLIGLANLVRLWKQMVDEGQWE